MMIFTETVDSVREGDARRVDRELREMLRGCQFCGKTHVQPRAVRAERPLSSPEAREIVVH